MVTTEMVKNSVKKPFNGKLALVENFHFCRDEPQESSYNEDDLQGPGFSANDLVLIISHVDTYDNLHKEWCYVMRCDGFQGWLCTTWIKVLS